MWIEDAALECWQTIGPSGQARYTGAAIQTSLMLRAAFKLPLRQIEGLMTSVLSLMGFRQFLLRGIDRVRSEWSLVTMAWNMKRMFVLRPA